MLDYLARKAITAQQKNAMTARQHFSVNIDIILHKLTMRNIFLQLLISFLIVIKMFMFTFVHSALNKG